MGYINAKGNIVIPPQWDIADEFHEGIARVRNYSSHENGDTTTSSYIDTSGKVILKDIELDSLHYGYCSEGLIPFTENGKTGFIDKSGAIVIPAKFFCEPPEGDCGCSCEDGSVGYFENGVTWAKLGHVEILIDRTGKEILRGENARFAARRHIEGLAPFKKAGLYGYKDSKGKVVIPPQFSSAGEFSEGIASVSPKGQENEYIYIDKKGHKICDQVFRFTYQFSEGLGLASIEDDYVIVTKTGKIIPLPLGTSPQQQGQFKHGILSATIHDPYSPDSQEVFINPKGEVIARFRRATYSLFGDRIETPFDGVLARIYCQDDRSEKWVDRNGKVIWSNLPQNTPNQNR